MNPHMLNQMGLNVVMSGPIMQRLMHMQEKYPGLCSGLWLNQLTLKFLVLVIDVGISLFLNDYVVDDGTCCHHLSHPLSASDSSRVW
jgi:hypothetical protein